MNSYCLLLIVLCSAFIIQNVNSIKIKSNSTATASVFAKITASVYVPKDYKIAITPYTGIQARDVGIGADGTIWIISNTKEGTNYATYRLQPGSSAFEKITGQAMWISVAPDGNAWVVTNENKIFTWVGTTAWKQITGTAYDISCSPDGNIFHIGTSNGIYMLNRDGAAWTHVSGSAVRVAGGLHQSAWHLNSAKEIYRSIPGTWEQVTGQQGTDIAVGANGYVWLLNADPANPLAIYDESRQGWVQVPLSDYLARSGSAANNSPIVRIAAAPNGDVIGVRQDYTMFRMSFSWN